MNIFENLIEELKEENLLEETVIETHPADEKSDESDDFSNEDVILSEDDESANSGEVFEDDHAEVEDAESNDFDSVQEENIPETVAEASKSAAPEYPPEPKKPPVNSAEFYRQRAMKEVSGLQMVEHVLSGVERDLMKVVPKPYDDLEAKKILHQFMQVSGDLNSPEHAQAEFKLMQETESWYSALSRRDKNVSVSHLRRYCETTRPLLSSQALIAIARFYRNSPYSEAARSKFDLIITRLFAKDAGDDNRIMVFEREEMIKHLTTLYAEWASVPLYSVNEDDSDILLMTLKFEDFMNEVDSADTFDELIKNDFFNRLRAFKESTNENFFAPLVTSTAIECNVRVGNRYVELLQLEKEKTNSEQLGDKYGFLHDQSISEAASKTLHLVDLLNQTAERDEEEVEFEAEENEASQTSAAKSVKKTRPKEKRSRFAVNKWLLLATIVIVGLNVALYIWSTYNSGMEDVTKNVKVVNLENSVLKEFVREGRIANDTFFGVVQPVWTSLSQEKKQDVLKKVFSTGNDKGFNKVHLLDSQGKTVGYADSEKVEVF